MNGACRAAWQAVAALALLCCAAMAAARPARIVSINPCLDAILIEVADPAQIAGISHYSRDPRATSIPLEKASRFAATSGTAEEIIALKPDLVLSGIPAAPSTLAVLARLKVPVASFGIATSVAESRRQVQAIAAAVGHPERGAPLVARIDAAMAAAHRPGRPVPALIWQGGGLVPGRGTLVDELMRHAGLYNQSAGFGLRNWDVLPLELLAARPPQLLFIDTTADDPMLHHPVLDRLAKRMKREPFPERLLSCAGPTIVPAVARLSAARDRL
jgi:iron complex transport system substrate-binding protein